MYGERLFRIGLLSSAQVQQIKNMLNDTAEDMDGLMDAWHDGDGQHFAVYESHMRAILPRHFAFVRGKRAPLGFIFRFADDPAINLRYSIWPDGRKDVAVTGDRTRS